MKRKKYAEELEARMSDEEVKVIVKAKKSNKEPALQLFVVRTPAYNFHIALSWVLHDKYCTRVQSAAKLISVMIKSKF